jgi:uncharacterized protein (DUF362 family)
MSDPYSRRKLFQLAGVAAGAMAANRGALAQQAAPGGAPPAGRRGPGGQGRAAAPGGGSPLGGGHPDPFPALATRSTVSLIKGEDRRKNVYQALMAIDAEIQPKLKNKKYVLLKPNNVTTTNQLGATHADALRGMLDYFSTRFKGPVVIAESSAGNTMQGFETFGYTKLPGEYKSQKVQLIDLNEEGRYFLLPFIDFDIHVVPVRLAARLIDPDAFVVSAACLKTHNFAVVTLSVKNVVVGAALHQGPKETTRWNDKRRFHVGVRQFVYNMFLTAQKLQPNWGVTVIDGFEGMEGSGPASGTPVASRIALGSTDYIAADRVAAECMGVDPNWLGWLKYAGEVGIGQWDLSKIDVKGPRIAEVQKKYLMHRDIENQLKWMGPMQELPPNLGWVRPIGCHPDEALG